MNYGYLIEGMTWSFSRIGSYLDCPYRFLLKYVLCRPQKEEMFFTDYGVLVHELIADCLKGKYKKEDMPALYAERFDSEIKSPAPSQNIYDKYREDGARYFDRFDFPYEDILAVEKKVKFEVGRYKFTGVIDCLASDDGRLVLVDHKSRTLQPKSGKNPPLKRDAEVDEYFRQLYLYCKPVFETYGRFPDRLELNCFRNGNLISEPFDHDKYDDTLRFFSKTIDEIVARSDWPPSVDAFACKNLCEMSGECEYCEE